MGVIGQNFRGGAQVFIEDRIQVRISGSPSGPVERSEIRVVGVALDGERTLHISDPPMSRLSAEAGDEPLSQVLTVPSLPLEEWRTLVGNLARDGVAARV